MFSTEALPTQTTLGKRLRRLLSRWSVGMRLAMLMGLAAAAGLALATHGLRGMAYTAQELQRVHDERMVPVGVLSEIAQLMLANQHLLQMALAGAPADLLSAKTQPPTLSAATAAETTDTIARNAQRITELWNGYAQALPAEGAERDLADRIELQRAAYLQDGIAPALNALRGLDPAQTLAHSRSAQDLYQQTHEQLQALMALQYAKARSAYQQGMQKYRQTRNDALIALPIIVLLLALLGYNEIRAITVPLRSARAVFGRIARGRLDTAIEVHGRDETSSLLRDLSRLQTLLADHEREIDHLIHYDQLTGLPNRRLLRDRMARAVQMHATTPGQRALLLLDLDHFKDINDTCGHEVGDQYLQEVARRLSAVAWPLHLVARIGGDEFVVLTELLPASYADALVQTQALAHELLKQMVLPWTAQGLVHHGSASIGICLFDSWQIGIAELLKRADTAMYEAKQAGRNRWCLFDPEMQTRLEYRTTLGRALHDAVPGRQLALHLQPQLDTEGHVIGAEALLRWSHPRYGAIPPDVFIPLAEADGSIVPIGRWVLQQACAQLALWQQSPHTRALKLAVNVSSRQFKQMDFTQQVLSALQASGAQAQGLVLELTESLLIDDIEGTVSKMRELHRGGVRFALDDFGTGYSSLSMLRQLPLDAIKIDRSFVRDVASTSGSATLVRTITAMARSLGMQTIAEGVETPAQQATLLAQDCRFYQGYLFARPMPPAQFADWLQARGTTPSQAKETHP